MESSRRLIANVTAMPEAARQHPTVKADLAQAQAVVAAADGQRAQTQNASQFPSSPLHDRRDQRPAPEAAKITSQLPDDAEPGDANNTKPSGSRSKDEWEGLLKSWQKPSPVRAEDVLNWKPSHPISPELRKNMTDAAQALLDMLPEDVAKSLGKVDIEVMASLRKGVPAQYFPDRNTIVFSHQQMGGHNPLQVRKLMWHEVAHWLFDKSGEANAHSHLKAWRAKLEQHWIERTRGEPVATEPVEKWRFIRDGWISDYVGRLYPGEPIGLELPAVYLEEAAAGGSRLAWLGRHHPHAQETFDIILSIFQK